MRTSIPTHVIAPVGLENDAFEPAHRTATAADDDVVFVTSIPTGIIAPADLKNDVFEPAQATAAAAGVAFTELVPESLFECRRIRSRSLTSTYYYVHRTYIIPGIAQQH